MTPPPIPKDYVRVSGNKILSPSGNPVYLKIFNWNNFYERPETVYPLQITTFMDYMQTVGGNCLLFKGNTFLINDQLQPVSTKLATMHNLIQQAEDRGIYTMLNIFDTWSRGKNTDAITTDNNQHPINVWEKGHTERAVNYFKWFIREFRKYPRVIFELGNEMDWGHHSTNWQTFHWMAKNHLLIHYYNMVPKDRPIGVSQRNLWTLDVNILFNHHSTNMPNVGPNDRPIVTNELGDRNLWDDKTINDPAHSSKYTTAFALAKARNHSGCAAATGLRIHDTLSQTVKNVLFALGGY